MYNILNSRKAGWLAILIAVAAKSLLGALFNGYEGDKSFYLLMAKSLADGSGFTIPIDVLNLPSVTEQVYHPSAITPLYSLIIAPILWLLPGNYFLATFLIEITSWLFLFIVLRKLLFRITQDHFWTNTFILFSGFFLYNIELGSPYKDVPAVVLLLLGLLQCLHIASKSGSTTVLSYIFTSILFVLPGLIKLTYLPLAIVFPLSLLWVGFLNKKSKLLRNAAVLGLVTVILLGAHHFFFRWYAASNYASVPSYYWQYWSMSNTGQDFRPGFFPSNLLRMYAFIPASIANLDMMGVQVQSRMPSLTDTYVRLLYIVQFAGLILMGGVLVHLSRKYYKSPFSDRIVFALTGLVLSLSLVLFLCLMSVRHQPIQYKGSSVTWTYVAEIRPYFFPMLFLQIMLFAFLFARKHRTQFLRRSRLALLIVMGGWALHGCYFVVRAAFATTTGKGSAVSINQRALQLTDSIKKSNPAHDVWLATEMQHLDWYAKLHGQKTLRNLLFLNDSSFHLPANTILLTAINKEDTSRIRNYIHRDDVDRHNASTEAVLFFIQRETK